jgi:hypothetical protein
VVSALPVAGAAAVEGVRAVAGWLGDGRFAVVTRLAFSSRAVEVVDTYANALHASIDAGGVSHDDGSYVNADLAPAGLWFGFSLTHGKPRDALARVVDTGLYIKELEGLNHGTIFSADGKRLVYARPIADEWQALYVDLPNGSPTPITIGTPGPTSVHPSAFSIDASHMLAFVGAPDERAPLSRVNLSSGTALALASAERDSVSGATFADGSAVVIHYTDATSQELVLADVLGARAPTSLATFPFELRYAAVSQVGARHIAFSYDERDLTFVGQNDDGSAAPQLVSEASEAGFPCYLPPELASTAERFATTTDGGAKLMLIDLSNPIAARVMNLAPEHGGQFGCPEWNPAGDGFAIVETVAGSTAVEAFVYTVQWTDPSAPARPQLVHESDVELQLVAYRP